MCCQIFKFPHGLVTSLHNKLHDRVIELASKYLPYTHVLDDFLIQPDYTVQNRVFLLAITPTPTKNSLAAVVDPGHRDYLLIWYLW